MNTDSHKIYLIRIDSPEQSKAFQEKLFKTTDIIWRGGQKTPQYFSKELLTIKYYKNNYRLFIALMSRYELYKRSDNYIELSVSEIINSERHPFECVLKSSSSGSAEYLNTEFGGQKRGGSIRIRLPNKYTVRETCDTNEQAMNQSGKNMYGHPSDWSEFPDGVYPVRFMVMGDSDVYDVTSPRHAVWKKCPEALEQWKNAGGISLGWRNFYKAEGIMEAFLTMVEFSNGLIWEAGGRGWRHKDGDCKPEPLTIPLREKIYGRDTHAALMAAHRKRQETKLPDAAHSLIRSLCGDVLTYDGVEEG